MLERMAVGRAELGGEVDIAAELEHAVVVALEHRLGLFRRQLELLDVVRLVCLEGLAVLVLHQRHAEHVDAVALARAFGVEHEGPGDIVVVLLGAPRHRRSPLIAAGSRPRSGDVTADFGLTYMALCALATWRLVQAETIPSANFYDQYSFTGLSTS